MSKLYVVSVFVAFTLALFYLPLVTWFSLRTLRFIMELWGSSRDNNSQSNSDKSGLRWTLSITLCTSLSFVGAQIANVVFTSDLVHHYFTAKNGSKTLLDEDSRSSNPGFLAIAVLFAFSLVGGRVGLLMVLCERMRLSFESTQYGMSQCSVKSFRMIASLEVILNFSQIILFGANQLTLLAMVIAVDMMIYSTVSFSLAWSFFSRARKISSPMMNSKPQIIRKNTESTAATQSSSTLGLSPQKSNDSDHHSNLRPALKASVPSDSSFGIGKNGRSISVTSSSRLSQTRHNKAVGLMDAALKIALLSIVGMLSTVLSTAVQLAYLGIGNRQYEWIVNTIGLSDFVLNSFCLLCTFKQASRYYRSVFGRMHDFIRVWMNLF